MANSITAHTIQNGSRNLILAFNMVADGSGNESVAKLIDLNDYLEESNSATIRDFAVKKISGLTSAGCSVKFFFGSKTEDNRLFYETVTDRPFSEDWSNEGGISTGVPDTDLTIRFSTVGFDTALDVINLNIWIKKKYTKRA